MSRHRFLIVSLVAVLQLTICFTSAHRSIQEVNCEAARDTAIKAHQSSNNGWIPECDINGSFKTLQRNSSGTAFCVNPQGRMIFQPKSVNSATAVNCECPLQVFQILNKERKLGTFVPFCDATNGNYSPVQCHPGTSKKRVGVCYCVDIKGQYLGEKPKDVGDEYCLKNFSSSKKS